MDWSRAGLRAYGFRGFERVAAWHSWIDEVLPEPGVYVVISVEPGAPSFLDSNPGGRFKGCNPTVPRERLESEWIVGTKVLYVGKGDQLQRRIRQLTQFANGEPVGHWGGRLLWQLDGHESFEVAWLVTPSERPANVEVELITDFVEQFGRLPFANLQRPRGSR